MDVVGERVSDVADIKKRLDGAEKGHGKALAIVSQVLLVGEDCGNGHVAGKENVPAVTPVTGRTRAHLPL